MMKAIKDNKVYIINTDVEAEAYRAKGYDIYDEKNKLKAHGVGKTVTLDAYEILEKENAKLKAENKKLKAEDTADVTVKE